MKIPRQSERRLWLWAAAGAAILGMGFILMFREPLSTDRKEHAKVRARDYVPSEAVPQVGFRRVAPEEASLVDPSPLFLPTAWNTAQKEVALPKVGGAFADYPARFAYDEVEFRSLAPKNNAVVTIGGVLALNSPDTALLGMGRGSLQLPQLVQRSAVYEVAQAHGGRVVLAESLLDAHPPDAGIWEPIEFLAVVNAAGLSGPLVPTVRSKIEEVDAYFSNYLTQNLRIGSKLAPGVYRIWVGP